MLKLSMMTISLLTIQMLPIPYWWVSMATLLIMVPLSMLWLISSNSVWSMTQFSIMDSLSSTLIVLSILIASMMLLASSKIFFSQNPKNFAMMNTILLFILMNSFSASTMLSFYIWFEASLIPTLLIIMTWGYQPERMQASMYLMLYTITASLPMFMMFCSIYYSSNHNLMSMSTELLFPKSMSMHSFFWIMVMAGFLVKLPMFTVHLWLPKAHVEAPIAGSMVLAAILLKLGGYGLARMLTMFPKMSMSSSSVLMSVALYGGAITSFICMRQPDLKSLIAYSSVGHMGLMLTGMLSNTSWGLMGSLTMMIAHGLSSSALFSLANMSYEITNTRSIFLTKGLMCVAPTMTLWWFLFTGANMAAPPSINLLSEILLISSILSYSFSSIVAISLISFMTAAYSLHMFSSIQHGQVSSFTNPMLTLKSKDMLLLLTHLIPIIFLLFKPELIVNWI